MAEEPTTPQAQTAPTTTTSRRAASTAAPEPPAQPAPAAAPAAPTQADLDQAALDHEKALARTRGAPEDAMAEYEANLLWVHSNRKDDRTVIYEPDPLHPGGQAFVGGDGPDHVYRTPAIEALLQSGELIEVPEPQEFIEDPETGERVRNRFYPDQSYSQAGEVAANMPGQTTQLGRKLNPELWSEDQLKEIQRRQAYMPSYRPVPPGGIVPPAAPTPR